MILFKYTIIYFITIKYRKNFIKNKFFFVFFFKCNYYNIKLNNYEYKKKEILIFNKF